VGPVEVGRHSRLDAGRSVGRLAGAPKM
jgi:hypothetical protein